MNTAQTEPQTKTYEGAEILYAVGKFARVNLPYKNGSVTLESSLQICPEMKRYIEDHNLRHKNVNVITRGADLIWIDWDAPAEPALEFKSYEEQMRDTPAPKETTTEEKPLSPKEKALLALFGTTSPKNLKTQAPKVEPIPAFPTPEVPVHKFANPAPAPLPLPPNQLSRHDPPSLEVPVQKISGLSVNLSIDPDVPADQAAIAGTLSMEKDERIAWLAIMKCATAIIANQPDRTNNAWAEGTKTLLLTEYLFSATSEKFATSRSIKTILGISDD